jgi:hypothetical protein
MSYCIWNGHNQFMLKDRASNTLAVSVYIRGEEKYPYSFCESESYFTDAAKVCGRCRNFCLNEKCVYVILYLKVFSSHSCFTKRFPATSDIMTYIVFKIFARCFISSNGWIKLHCHMPIIGEYLNIIYLMLFLRSCYWLSLRQM